MKSRIKKWVKEHKPLSLLLSITLIMAIALLAVPAYAAVTYLDIDGTYTVRSYAGTTYLDNSARHPASTFATMTLDNTDQAVTGTLTSQGTSITLAGFLGSGSRPSLALAGTDSDGQAVSIVGRMLVRSGDVTGFAGKIQGYATSYGSRFDDSADGTAAISTADSYSGTYSCLLTGGTLANPEALLIHNPNTRFRLSQLDNLRENLYGFWFNLQNTKTPGPEIMLRFAPTDNTTTQTYYGGGTSGLVDITIMPYQGLTGDGTWVEYDMAVDDATIIYYGNDPTDYTSFGGTPLSDLAEVEAAINAEAAMTADDDSASNWVLTMISIELWEGGARTCYIDDVTIGGVTYTLEPTVYSGAFRATIQE